METKMERNETEGSENLDAETQLDNESQAEGAYTDAT